MSQKKYWLIQATKNISLKELKGITLKLDGTNAEEIQKIEDKSLIIKPMYNKCLQVLGGKRKLKTKGALSGSILISRKLPYDKKKSKITITKRKALPLDKIIRANQCL